MLYLVTFFCGAYLCWRYYQNGQKGPALPVILSVTALLGMLVGVGIITPVVGGFVCPLLFGEFFFAIVTAIVITPALLLLRRGEKDEIRTVVTGLLAIGILSMVIISQFGAAGLFPDHPEKTRMVLSAGEVEVQSWEAEFIEEPVPSDPYYSDFVSNPKHAVNEGRHYEMSNVSHPYHPGVIKNEELLNATLLNQEYKYFAYRTSVEIYNLGGGYKLTWDLQQALNQSYSKVYSNGDVDTYYNSST